VYLYRKPPPESSFVSEPSLKFFSCKLVDQELVVGVILKLEALVRNVQNNSISICFTLQ